MNRNRNDRLERLMQLARQAPTTVPSAIRPGFASRVALLAGEGEAKARKDDVFACALRWAILGCATVTLIIAALNAPSVVGSRFAPESAFEAHVSNLVLLKNR